MNSFFHGFSEELTKLAARRMISGMGGIGKLTIEELKYLGEILSGRKKPAMSSAGKETFMGMASGTRQIAKKPSLEQIERRMK